MMIDFKKYGLDDETIEFITETEDWCIAGQSEMVLEYKGYTFGIEPLGEEVLLVDKTGEIGRYDSFENMLLNHKIDGKPVIELAKDLEYSDWTPIKDDGNYDD